MSCLSQFYMVIMFVVVVLANFKGGCREIYDDLLFGAFERRLGSHTKSEKSHSAS